MVLEVEIATGNAFKNLKLVIQKTATGFISLENWDWKLLEVECHETRGLASNGWL